MAGKTWDQKLGGTSDIRDAIVSMQVGVRKCAKGHTSPMFFSQCEFHAAQEAYIRKVVGGTAS